MIIDTHTHFYDPTRPQGVPWPPADNELLYRTVLPEHARALAEPEGVTGTVVVEASAWLEDNQWILDLAANDSFIVGLVGHIDANRPEFGAELARFADHPLFCGIRCGGGYFADIEAGSFLGDMELLAGHDLELDAIGGKDMLGPVAALAQRLPGLRIVINHVAAVTIDGQAPDPEWVDAIGQVGQCDNVYMKVSALLENSKQQPAPAEVDYYRPALDAMWDAFGEDRLVYGSNWPVSERSGDYRRGIDIVKAYFADKGEAAYEKYFWRNSQAAYRWLER
ncbi:MAG: amidohydrolase family protein [Candidatus Latescibacteria bacterium]|nr:amidohydrolase family protein [Candidatus Latescibacterota bacterium]